MSLKRNTFLETLIPDSFTDFPKMDEEYKFLRDLREKLTIKLDSPNLPITL